MATLDRDKALDMALAQIDKQFGKGSVMRLGDSPEVVMKVIPTGSVALDIALGVGGLHDRPLTQAHDRALAELLVDLRERGVERLVAIHSCHLVHPSGSWVPRGRHSR